MNKQAARIEKMYMAENQGAPAGVSLNHDAANRYGEWSATVGSHSVRAGTVDGALNALETKMRELLSSKRRTHRDALANIDTALELNLDVVK